MRGCGTIRELAGQGRNEETVMLGPEWSGEGVMILSLIFDSDPLFGIKVLREGRGGGAKSPIPTPHLLARGGGWSLSGRTEGPPQNGQTLVANVCAW